MTALRGRVCLVTGSTSGIGLVTARELARMGATVIAVSRDPARGARAAAEIGRAGGGAPVELLVGDLSSQQDVRRIAAEALARHDRLDVLVNNAGAVYAERELTVDGLERTFAVNHLAYFLLTVLLRPALERAPAARVVSVSSDAHRGVRRLDFDNLQGERRYRGMLAYCQSKLANVLFTRELARRLRDTRVTANALHPGLVASNFGHNNRGALSVLFTLARPFSIGPERGARTSIYLASSPEVAGVTGEYFVRRRRRRPSAGARDDDAARRLWALSESLANAAW